MKKFFLIAFLAFSIPANYAQSVDLNFGAIEFIVGGGNFNATLDPVTGSIACNNSSYFTCQSFGTPGNTTILGDSGSLISIRCRATARISNGSSTFDVGASEVYIVGQSKVRCTGLNNEILTHTISANPSSNIIYWGGRLKVRGTGNSDFSGLYTTNGGGNSRPQTIRIVFL